MRPPDISLRERATEALTVMVSKDPLVGIEFAGYHILEPIGRGGMGAVYLARSERHEEPVAVKVMLPELTGNEEFRRRFIREAQSGLEHPNIVPILDAGDVDDVLYLTMPYIDGVDLKNLVARETRLSPGRAVSILEQAAGALDHAHENGIVHRDVKPQNILVKQAEGSGRIESVFLTDFGLVKKISSQSSFTTSAYLMGTLHYMAPEQIEGKPLDGRTDVYALACVIYECLTGTVPFDKESEVAVLWAHMNEEPPSVVAKEPLLPDAIDLVLAKAMAKSPDDRYLTAGEFASGFALEFGGSRGRVRSVWGPGQVSASGKRSRPLQRELAARAAAKALPAPVPTAPRMKGFAVGVAAAFALFGVWFGFGDADRRAAIGSFVDEVTEAPFLGLAGEPDETEERSELPSGARNRADVRGEGRDGFDLLPPSSLVASKVPSDRSAPQIADPPAQKVAPPTVAGAAAPSGPRPKLVFGSSIRDDEEGGGHALYTMNPDGSGMKMIMNSLNDDYDAEWSPDRSQIAFAAGFRVFVMGADGSDARAVSPSEGWARRPSWSPDGSKIAFEYSASADQTFDYEQGWGLVLVDVADPRVIQTLTPIAGSDHDPAWSPDGSKISFTSHRDDPEGDIFVISVGAQSVTKVIGGEGAQRQATWTRNGKALAFSGQTSEVSGFDIYIQPLRDGARKRVTRLGRAFAPDFSPKGNRLVFIGGYTEVNRRYEGLFYMTVARRGGTPVRLTRASYWDDTADWR